MKNLGINILYGLVFICVIALIIIFVVGVWQYSHPEDYFPTKGIVEDKFVHEHHSTGVYSLGKGMKTVINSDGDVEYCINIVDTIKGKVRRNTMKLSLEEWNKIKEGDYFKTTTEQ